MSKPTLRSAQSPITTGPNGALSAEWFRFFSELLAYAASQDGRIAALEGRLAALEDRLAKKGV